MFYVKIENDVLKGFYCSDYLPENCVEVEENWNGRIGEPLSFYDEQLNRKTDCQLIKESLIEMPLGYKWNEDKTEIIPLNQIERYKAGIDKIPDGFKIENNKLVEMTIQEKIEAGFMTQKEVDEQEISELKEYLSSTDYVTIKIMEGAATKEEYLDVLAKRKETREKINELELQNA